MKNAKKNKNNYTLGEQSQIELNRSQLRTQSFLALKPWLQKNMVL